MCGYTFPARLKSCTYSGPKSLKVCDLHHFVEVNASTLNIDIKFLYFWGKNRASYTPKFPSQYAPAFLRPD